MWKRSIFAALSLSLLPLLLPAVEPDPLSLQQTMLSSRLREALTSSRQSMTDLEAYYNSMIHGLENRLQEQSRELIELSSYLTSTMNSFRALSQELENSMRSYLLERQRRQARDRIIAVFALAFGFMVAGKVSVAVLSARGIPIPKWIKIMV